MNVDGMKKNILLILFLTVSVFSFAQSRRISGTLIDKDTKEGVMQAGTPEEKVSMIPNMSKPDKFYPHEPNLEVAKQFGIDLTKFNVIHFGSMGRANGLQYIIEAAKVLHDKGDDTVRYYADLTGRMLEEIGINLDFAPVADVNVNPRCPVIGGIERSFSGDPAVVRRCCLIWSEELLGHNVVSCFKHFPGHGSATGDTHKGLVDVTDTWQRCELEPYRDLPSANMMVMTAHVVNRQLDPTGLPASLSPKITSYLRDTLGFQGVVVTDDLAMGAIVQQYSFEKAIRMAVLAGADLLCLSNNGGTYDPNMVPRAVKVIKQMVADGEITEERIRQSAGRVRSCGLRL